MKNAADERILGERKKRIPKMDTLNTKSNRVDEEKKIEATKASDV